MDSFGIGDLVFILFIAGVIYGILTLVNRPGNGKGGPGA